MSSDPDLSASLREVVTNGHMVVSSFAAMQLMYSHHVSILIFVDQSILIKALVGGQGIASGFRDAVSLAWRLALLCRRQPSTKPSNHEEVLSGWYIERKQQLEKSLSSTIENGKFVMESNPIKIFIRDWYLYCMHFIPSWRHSLRLGRRKEGQVQYMYSPGLPFDPTQKGGVCLPQVYCKPVDGSQKVFFSDDVIFGKKTGLLQLLVYLKDENELAFARNAVSRVHGISKGEIHADEITFLIEGFEINSNTARVKSQSGLYCLATGDEFARSPLCRGRPEPMYYDPFCLTKILGGNKFVLVRPDRFVYAACNGAPELEKAVSGAIEYLQQ